MAHPFKTKAIAFSRIKTDSIDAKTLCHLLRSDLIPPSYIASHSELDNRELSRGRINLVHDKTLLKNRVMAILGKENLNYEGSDMFGTAGKDWLSKQVLSETKKCMVEIYLEKINDLEKTISQLDKLIKQRSSDFPEVKLLTSIPGIGTITAFLLASEIGDINRFTSSKSFASYFGLVPRLNQSGNHAYYGRITKLGNPYVRWSLVQASHRMVRMDSEAKRFVTRLSFKGGKKKAIVAWARKLSTIIFCILKENRPYINNYRCPEKSRPAIIPERSRLAG
jgi:transposase